MELVELQYAWMLGVVFLKKACNVDDFAEAQTVTFDGPPRSNEAAREAIRTLAYVIGEKILQGLASKQGVRA